MGIVNVTPDSFSDGGQFASAQQAIDHARSLVADGADLLDIGGESTRPQAQPVNEEEELHRVLPVVQGLLDAGVPLSIDTRRPRVMQEAVLLGVDLLNDVNGFRDPAAFEVAVNSGCGLCIMHMQGSPQTMQTDPHYQDVVKEVSDVLLDQKNRFIARGVDARRILIDPGFGFGKTLEHNLALMSAISGLAAAHPVLVGVSRKSMIGAITGQKDPAARVAGSLAAALWAASQGAQMLRVHDVKATVDALRVWRCLGKA